MFTTHHPHHALAVADDVFLMGESDFACGAAGEVLSEKNLRALYGVDIKLLPFEHKGRMLKTLVPVLQPSLLDWTAGSL